MGETRDRELTFEAAFQELEGIVERLESGDLTLDEAIALFERGQALARLCDGKLEQAELRVGQLLPDAEGGYREASFEREA